MSDAIHNLLEFDKETHGGDALFLDKKESRFTDPLANAGRFYLSVFTSHFTQRAREGRPLELPAGERNGGGFPEPKEEELAVAFDNGFYDKKIPLYYALGDYFKRYLHLCTTKEFDLIWNGTHYELTYVTKIEKKITELTQRKVRTAAGINNFFKFTKTACCDSYDKLLEPAGLINLRNGILNPKTKKLIPHDPKYRFRSVIDIDYDPDAKCPIWEKTLREIFQDNTKEDGIDYETAALIQQIGAYILVGGYPFLHKAFFLTGSGRNGKSTVLWVLEQLLGEDNVSSVSMSNLDKEFHTILMHGKLANLCEEFPADRVNSEQFKNIVGGGKISMSHKHKNIFQDYVYARLLFAVNKMPTFDKDKSVGLMDRLVFVNFPNYFASWERDYQLKEKLSKEMPGILNFFLQPLPFSKDFQLIEPGSSKSLKRDFTHKSDTVRAYFENAIEVTSNPEHKMSNYSLYEKYKEFCIESGRGGNNNQYISGKKNFLNAVRDHVKVELKEKSIDHSNTEFKDKFSRGILYIQPKRYDIEDL